MPESKIVILHSILMRDCYVDVIEFTGFIEVLRVMYWKKGDYEIKHHDIIPENEMQYKAMRYLLECGVDPDGWQDGCGGNVSIDRGVRDILLNDKIE